MQRTERLSKQVKAFPGRLVSVFTGVVPEGVQPREEEQKRAETC